MKFAYLITAHKETSILHYLLRMIDNEDNDIYIHWDLKSAIPNGLVNTVSKSKIKFVEERYDVRWGNISQVQAEYALFKTAYNSHEPYDYFHLISAADIPIKSNVYMQSFFKKNEGKNFIGFCKQPLANRVKYKHLFINRLRGRNRLYAYCDDAYVLIQKIFKKENPGLKGKTIAKGPNWCSVTKQFVEVLIQKERWVIDTFAKAKNPDEYYKQTVALNEDFISTVFDMNDEYRGCQRLIDWNRGKPYCWVLSDLGEIVKSDYLFCRKIEDEQLAEALYNEITLQENG